mmetsp:Transcript_32004/g.58638  ORF Transcript_32004/g.58638 Transcript_32004/m.58638 type:complete len:115 (+) Transcript_32004:1-345(+)
MRAAFEVNALGPLRIQKALLDANLMKTSESKEGASSMMGKVAIISTGLSSIGDNTSGGNYAYPTSKAAVNMIAKSRVAISNFGEVDRSRFRRNRIWTGEGGDERMGCNARWSVV